jgi:hypothetical protein
LVLYKIQLKEIWDREIANIIRRQTKKESDVKT